MSKASIPKNRKPEDEDREKLVLTPGGWRPKSKVRFLKPGEHIDGEGGRLKIVNSATGEVIEDLGEISPEEPVESKPHEIRAASQGKKNKKAKTKSTRNQTGE